MLYAGEKAGEKLEPQYAELKAMISDNSIKYAEVEKAANALTGYKNADYYKFYIEQCEKLAQSNTLQSIAFAYKDSDTYAIATINKSDSNWDYVEVIHSEKSNGGKLDTDQVSQKLSDFFQNMFFIQKISIRYLMMTAKPTKRGCDYEK